MSALGEAATAVGKELIGEGGEQLAKEGAQQVGKNLAEEATQQVAKDAAEEMAGQAAKEGTEQAVKEGAEELAEGAGKEAAEQGAKDAAEQGAKHTLEHVGTEGGEDAAKEAGEDAAKGTGKAATDGPTLPKEEELTLEERMEQVTGGLTKEKADARVEAQVAERMAEKGATEGAEKGTGRIGKLWGNAKASAKEGAKNTGKGIAKKAGKGAAIVGGVAVTDYGLRRSAGQSPSEALEGVQEDAKNVTDFGGKVLDTGSQIVNKASGFLPFLTNYLSENKNWLLPVGGAAIGAKLIGNIFDTKSKTSMLSKVGNIAIAAGAAFLGLDMYGKYTKQKQGETTTTENESIDAEAYENGTKDDTAYDANQSNVAEFLSDDDKQPPAVSEPTTGQKMTEEMTLQA